MELLVDALKLNKDFFRSAVDFMTMDIDLSKLLLVITSIVYPLETNHLQSLNPDLGETSTSY